MKCLNLIVLLFGFQSLAQTSYSCRSQNGTRASLVITNAKLINWYDHSRSASSIGQYIGIESAWKNYHQYRLLDFYLTNDSSYILALDKSIGRKIKAIVYFDNDDHPENIEEFLCIAK